MTTFINQTKMKAKEIVKKVGKHVQSKGHEIGKIYLPREWIGRKVRVRVVDE